MGGKHGGGITAYKIYLGMHMAVCAGPVDKVRRILVDDSVAYLGNKENNTSIKINKPDLFGGTSSEGGVEGTVDLDFGYPNRKPNAYLQSQQEVVPAYRGILSAILNHCYVGMNPYLKDWSFLVQRVHTAEFGAKQWYDEKAPIGHSLGGGLELYVGFDTSGSMTDRTSNGRLRGENAVAALSGVLDYISERLDTGEIKYAKVGINTFSSEGSFDYRHESRTDSGTTEFSNLKDFLNNIVFRGNTYWEYGLQYVSDFFSAKSDVNKIVLFMTDGVPSTEQTVINTKKIIDNLGNSVDFHAIGIDTGGTAELASIDKNYLTVSGGDPEALADLLKGYIYQQVDMNPAHIIRECLTAETWGMNLSADYIDDAAFKSAADTLYDERFGMSLTYSNTGELKEFLQKILDCINAVLYQDRETGKYVLKLIRDDYEVADLPVIDETHIVSISDFVRPQTSELTNYATITYTVPYTKKSSSVSVQDAALIQQQGYVVSMTNNYVGISSDAIALMIAERDLRAASYPFLSCEIKTDRFAVDNLYVGDCFVLNYPRYGVANVVMRVVEINWGKATDNTVTIKCSEDVFSTAAPIYSVPESLNPRPTNSDITVVNPLITDAPYYILAQSQGDRDASQTEESDAYLFVAGQRPTSRAIRAWIHTSSDGDTYQRAGTLNFCPAGTITQDLGLTDTSVTVSMTDDDDLAVGDALQIGTGDTMEIVRIDAISDDTLTIARGCLDTVPHEHASGDNCWAWLELYGTDSDSHLAGEDLHVKLQTNAAGYSLPDLSTLTDFSLTFTNRAFLPYPPANVQFDGELYPESDFNAPMTITWVDRNRLQQTAGLIGFIEDNVSVEDGVTYYLKIVETDSDGAETIALDENIGYVNTYAYTPSGGTMFAEFTLWAVRDGYKSMQAFNHRLSCGFTAPYNVKLKDGEFTAPYDLTITDKDI